MLALEGFTDLTETFTLPLISTVLEVALRVIFVGFPFTVILIVDFTFLFVLEVAVIFTVPFFLPVTVPLEDTVAIFLLLDL